jgi:hypothetical protein
MGALQTYPRIIGSKPFILPYSIHARRGVELFGNHFVGRGRQKTRIRKSVDKSSGKGNAGQISSLISDTRPRRLKSPPPAYVARRRLIAFREESGLRTGNGVTHQKRSGLPTGSCFPGTASKDGFRLLTARLRAIALCVVLPMIFSKPPGDHCCEIVDHTEKDWAKLAS